MCKIEKNNDHLLFKTLLSLLSVVLTFLILEIGIRFYELRFEKISFSQSICNYANSSFGWNGTIITDQFRKDKKKIFIVGDSFTEGNGIDESNTYYSILKNNLDADFFVYGGPGYGTTQELLVIKNYIDHVNPDLIILQICGNDIVNNSFNLEKRSYYNNNRMPRPYYIDGKIQILYPSRFGPSRYFLECKSRLLYRFFSEVDQVNKWLAINKIVRSTENDLEENNSFPDYTHSLKITEQLIDQIISLSTDIPIIFLPANQGELEFYSLFKNRADDENVYWLDQPNIILSKIINDGKKVLQEDGNHWNELGHKYFGETLLKNLIEKSIVPEVIPLIL
jgi:hypothetical protein